MGGCPQLLVKTSDGKNCYILFALNWKILSDIRI
jgi:hypothetical protein